MKCAPNWVSPMRGGHILGKLARGPSGGGTLPPSSGENAGPIPPITRLAHATYNVGKGLGEDSMLRWFVAGGLVLLTTAALADSKSDCLDSKDHYSSYQRLLGKRTLQSQGRDCLS